MKRTRLGMARPAPHPRHRPPHPHLGHAHPSLTHTAPSTIAATSIHDSAAPSRTRPPALVQHARPLTRQPARSRPHVHGSGIRHAQPHGLDTEARGASKVWGDLGRSPHWGASGPFVLAGWFKTNLIRGRDPQIELIAGLARIGLIRNSNRPRRSAYVLEIRLR